MHNKKDPFFSIVIPTYNRAHCISTTLESVLNQTFSDYECLIVDDGSQDSEQLKKIVEDIKDPRFQYHWQENGGGGSARNTGILAASGQYIAFLDSDDLFLPTKLSIFAQHILKEAQNDPNSTEPQNRLKGFYSSMYVDRGVDKHWIRPNRGIAAGEDMGEYLFVQNQFIQTSTIVLSRKIAREVLFDPGLRKGQDLDFCLRLHKFGVRFTMIDKPLTVWVDTTEEGRTSRTTGYTAPLEWLERSRLLLTKKAALGYRATVLFYFLAKQKPLTGLIDLTKGFLIAGVPPKVIARQLLRGFLPRSAYRKLVNLFVGRSGNHIS